MFKLRHILFVLALTGCTSSEVKMVPGIVPNTAKEKQVVKIMPSNVIGEIEPVYLLPMKSPFMSRIDTGATTSALDAEDIKPFERDGRRWVSFTVINRATKEKYTFEKPLLKNAKIKRIGEQEKRPMVEMEVRMGKDVFRANFTVAEREKFEYQTLIGRNILYGRAIVDVTLSNTLK